MTDGHFYPELPKEGGNQFRLAKSSEALESLKGEVKHYEGVRKKYDRARGIIHNIGVGTGILGVTLTSAALGTSLTGVGVPIAVPVGALDFRNCFRSGRCSFKKAFFKSLQA